jgi:hypothetical protein
MAHKVTDKKFNKLFTDLGYTTILRENRNLVVFTNNGIKCELKPTGYTFGWLRKPDEIEIIRKEITDLGFELKNQVPGWINVKFPTKASAVLSSFEYIVERLNSIESIKPRERWQGQATKVFTEEIADTEIFLKIVKRYRHAIAEKDQRLLDATRVLLDGDSIDHLITVGVSKNRTNDNTYREHIVPCIMIHNQLIDMCLNGKTLCEMAQFLKTHLAIVLVTKQEAEKMDIELGMRTSMPDGWKWGDSVFSRLEAAEIEVL